MIDTIPIDPPDEANDGGQSWQGVGGFQSGDVGSGIQRLDGDPFRPLPFEIGEVGKT